MARLPNLSNRLKALNWRRIVLLGTLLLLVFGGYKAQRIWGLVRSLQNRLDQLQAMADGSADLELREATTSLQGVHSDLMALRGQVAFLMPLARHLGWVPGVGGDLQAAPALLNMALAVTEAGTIAVDGLEPLLALAEGEKSESKPLALVIQTLSDARPDLKAAQERLAAARAHRAEIDERELSSRSAKLVAQLDRYLPLVETALDVGHLLPDLLGASGHRTYLILIQNNDELRATGGLISAVGTLILKDGEIVDLSFKDSYTIDDFGHPYPSPPPTFTHYTGNELWVFRDANWWPDFPTSAQAALDLYQISRNLEPDGVLAVDQFALKTIVAALEPLEVKEWPELVTADNVIPLIRMAWSPTEVEDWQGFDYEWWKQRKSFIGHLTKTLRDKVQETPDQVNWLALARAIFQILDQRQLQIWLTDTDSPAATLLAEKGWDGALRQAAGDYLMIVDTNLGYNKVNALIQERVDYRVLVDTNGTAQATLTIHHVNSSSGDEPCNHEPHYSSDYDEIMNRCYWNYLRVYTALGSQLYAATAHPVAAKWMLTHQPQSGKAEVLPDEKNKTVFSSFFVLPRAQETKTRFVYELPPGVLESPSDGAAGQVWRYRLHVQKQAGTQAIPLRVTLDLPPATRVQEIIFAKGDSTIRQPDLNQVVLDTTLDKDRVFEVSFLLDQK